MLISARNNNIYSIYHLTCSIYNLTSHEQSQVEFLLQNDLMTSRKCHKGGKSGHHVTRDVLAA